MARRSTAVVNPLVTPSLGVTHASTSRLRDLLDRNHREHHIFMSNNIFHNHLNHSLLSAYALGASPALLDTLYAEQDDGLVPLDPTERDKVSDHKTRTDFPEIDLENWTDYLGISDAYSAYLDFFHAQVDRLGVEQALATFLFSPEANAGGPGNQQKAPRMLIRMVGGVLHPMIQLGFGAEFSDPLVVVEGLAETAVHSPDSIGRMWPDNWPHNSDSSEPLHGIPKEGAAPPSREEGISILEVYSRVYNSDKITMPSYDPDATIPARLKKAAEGDNALEVRRILAQWHLDPAAPDFENEISAEVQLLGALLACATSREGFKPRIDFFLMHICTSSIFLPSLLHLLPDPHHKLAFLRTYALAAIQTALARGRPPIDVDFPMARTESPRRPGSEVEEKEGNPWGDIVRCALHVPDCHTIKTVRTLMHLASLPRFALAPAGQLPHASSSSASGPPIFKGLDKADGTLFVRMAGMVMDCQLWDLPENKEKDWDRSALGWDEAWEEERKARL